MTTIPGSAANPVTPAYRGGSESFQIQPILDDFRYHQLRILLHLLWNPMDEKNLESSHNLEINNEYEVA